MRVSRHMPGPGVECESFLMMRNQMLPKVVSEQTVLGNPPYDYELGGIGFAQGVSRHLVAHASLRNPEDSQKMPNVWRTVSI